MSAYSEEHRIAYVALLGRLVEAYQQPASVRDEHAALLASITTQCRDERVKATSGWLHGAGPIAWDDPFIASTDAAFGDVTDIARQMAKARP